MFKVKRVFIDHHDAAFVVIEDKVIVASIQVLKIFQLDGLFVATSTFLDIADKMWHRGAEVNHEVGQMNHLEHLAEQFHIGLVVAVTEITEIVVVLHKDVDALEDGTVLNNSVTGLLNGDEIAKALFQKIHFEVERPPLDVIIVVLQLGVIVDRLKACLPPIMTGKHAGEGRLSAANVSCYGDVHGSYNGLNVLNLMTKILLFFIFSPICLVILIILPTFAATTNINNSIIKTLLPIETRILHNK